LLVEKREERDLGEHLGFGGGHGLANHRRGARGAQASSEHETCYSQADLRLGLAQPRSRILSDLLGGLLV
jgi:hypothetical protein